jgi:hypothetical protein
MALNLSRNLAHEEAGVPGRGSIAGVLSPSDTGMPPSQIWRSLDQEQISRSEKTVCEDGSLRVGPSNFILLIIYGKRCHV